MKNMNWVKKNANKFWETVANNWFIPLLTKVYEDEKKLKKIKKWTGDGKKVIILEITDFYMDPFFIILHGDGFELGMEKEEPDIILRGPKTKLIVDGPSLFRLIFSWFNKELEIKFNKSSLKDIFTFLKIFYLWAR